MQEEEEVCLDERLVAAQSALQSVWTAGSRTQRRRRKGYENYMRMSPELFQELLKCGPSLEKGDTFMRKAFRSGHRVAIALRYMATGDSYTKAFHTDHRPLGICYRYAAVVSWQFPTVTCGWLQKKWNFWTCWKLCHRKTKMVEAWYTRTSRSCVQTRDGYPTDNPGLKPWRFWHPNCESENWAL